MRVAIIQPSYLPWLGYFDLMSRVDTFVYLDDVQFTRRDWRNRNKIRTAEGWAWMTVPVEQKGKFAQLLKDTLIDNSSNWRRKHRESLRQHYSRAAHFDSYFPYFDSIYNKDWKYLLDLCYETNDYLQKQLGISTEILQSSALETSASKMDKILAICEKLKATVYLSGDAGRDYLVDGEFQKSRIELQFQDYQHPEYRQRYPGNISYLSVVDLLFNHGEQSAGIINQSSEEATGASYQYEPRIGL